MFKDEITVTGKLNVILVDQMGLVKEEHEFDNLVVTAGKGYIASRMKDASATAMTHMALGTNSQAAAAGQTALGAQAGSREALDSTTVTSNAVVYVASFEAGDATGNIVEAGLFNASSGGTMLCRTVFGSVAKQADDSMTVTWTVTISAS